MKSSEYWRKRFTDLEAASNAYGLQAFKQIEPAFKKAEREIQKQIEAWYGRYAKNNEISMRIARRQLSTKELKEFRWDVNEYIKYGRENTLNGEWMKELENASARYHVNRLEALKLRTQHAAEVAFGNELDAIDAMARKVLTEDYYHTIFEIQKGFNIGWDIGQIDERKLNRLITKPWAADGKNFSARIWQQRTQLVNELHNQLTRTCILGKAPDDAIKAISKKFNTTRNQAGRLVMTEQAYFHSVAQKEAFNELDVEKYEIVATLDNHTSDICQELDGKVFPMSQYEAGVTAPPFHVWCRTVTVPYFEDNYGGERAARDADGKTYYVPDTMKYGEWASEYVNDATYARQFTSRDIEQYNRYKAVLKELAPSSLDIFRKIKYNADDKWAELKYQYRTVNRYEIDGDVPIKTVLELDNVAWYTKKNCFDIENYQGKTNYDLRRKYKDFQQKGNTAAMSLDGEIYYSHSAVGSEKSFIHELYTGKYPLIGLEPVRKFKTFKVYNDVPREYDTEAKFLEFVAKQKNVTMW